MKAIILAFIAYCSQGLADDWRCTESGSEKSGTSFYACGVGSSDEESRARRLALSNAENEFYEMCEVSADCQNHHIDVTPGRTTCNKTESGYKCYRLIVYSILQDVMPASQWRRPTHVDPAVDAKPYWGKYSFSSN